MVSACRVPNSKETVWNKVWKPVIRAAELGAAWHNRAISFFWDQERDHAFDRIQEV